MDKTAIQAGKPPSANGRSAATAIQAGKPAAASIPQPRRAPKSLPWRALEYIASLRITVTLFALSLFLVFYGTLAQVDKNIWTVMAEYFRSLLVWIPVKLVTLWQIDLPFSIPYPGGWLLGGALLVNLLAAHIVSFKLTWRRSGIVLLHAGIVVMMLGELVTGLCAVESNMQIEEHGSSNYVFQYRYPELAVVDASDVKQDQVTVIPTAVLRKGGLITDAALPFDVDVREYMVNSNVVDLKADDKPQATHGQGRHFKIVALPEGTGVDKEQRVDFASAIVTLKRKGNGESLGTYALSTFLINPEWVNVDGKQYQVTLRFKRVYKDYTFRLDKLNIETYKNTTKPKDYSSFIHLTDPSRNEKRDVRIFMNFPFTYHGETFYQASVHQERGGKASTTLQVVHNPGWMMPYISCFMVATGMLFHFGLNLYRFVGRRAL
jgi:hypothetical protein